MITLKQFFVSRQIRRAFGGNDKKRDAGQTTPEDITRYDDILYGGSILMFTVQNLLLKQTVLLKNFL